MGLQRARPWDRYNVKELIIKHLELDEGNDVDNNINVTSLNSFCAHHLAPIYASRAQAERYVRRVEEVGAGSSIYVSSLSLLSVSWPRDKYQAEPKAMQAGTLLAPWEPTQLNRHRTRITSAYPIWWNYLLFPLWELCRFPSQLAPLKCICGYWNHSKAICCQLSRSSRLRDSISG